MWLPTKPVIPVIRALVITRPLLRFPFWMALNSRPWHPFLSWVDIPLQGAGRDWRGPEMSAIGGIG